MQWKTHQRYGASQRQVQTAEICRKRAHSGNTVRRALREVQTSLREEVIACSLWTREPRANGTCTRCIISHRPPRCVYRLRTRRTRGSTSATTGVRPRRICELRSWEHAGSLLSWSSKKASTRRSAFEARIRGQRSEQALPSRRSKSTLEAIELNQRSKPRFEANVRSQRSNSTLGATAAWSQRSKPALRASAWNRRVLAMPRPSRASLFRGQRRLTTASPEAFQQIDT